LHIWAIADLSFTNPLSNTIESFIACAILSQNDCILDTCFDIENFQIFVVKPLKENRVSELSAGETIWSVSLSLRNEITDFVSPNPKLILVTDAPRLVSNSNNVFEVAAFGKRKLVPFTTFSSFGIFVSNSKRADTAVIFLPVHVNKLHLVARERFYCFNPTRSRSINSEWPVLIVFSVMADFTAEYSPEAVTRTYHLTRLCKNDVVVASSNPVDNLIVPIAEPISVHFLELVEVCLAGRSFSWTPHVVFMTTVVEESTVISQYETCELRNVYLLDIGARKSIREWDFSELLGLPYFLGLDISAHSVDGVVCSYECQVV
jgi:hypothetical protein